MTPSPSVSPSEGTMGLSVSSVDGDSETHQRTPVLCWADDEPECGGDNDLMSIDTPRPLKQEVEVVPFPHNCIVGSGYTFPVPDWTPPEMRWFEPPPGVCSCRECNPLGGHWDSFFQVPPAHLTAHMYPSPAPMAIHKKKRRRGRRGRGKSKKKVDAAGGQSNDSDSESEE
eukprot:TRINITY_DN16992_c0_g2_i1.p1 TRINITY_DN16992_c0_g2~~TRINITY_DN16992_c0_g2_i1.p1  ORF type:complete len:171 (+),score=59.00 TRINITY_DN16992_c0_g2_i1:2-514(+)